jgi:hypothetical protein
MTLEYMNVECLDQKSPINHSLKDFHPTNMLLPQLIAPNPTLGLELLE